MLRLRGLPYDATADDVASFFAGFSLATPDDGAPAPPSSAVHIVPRVAVTVTPTGTAAPAPEGAAPRGSGVAFVRFSSADEASRARAARHRATLGDRYVECLPSLPPRARGRSARGGRGGRGRGGGPPGRLPTDSPPPPPGGVARGVPMMPPPGWQVAPYMMARPAGGLYGGAAGGAGMYVPPPPPHQQHQQRGPHSYGPPSPLGWQVMPTQAAAAAAAAAAAWHVYPQSPSRPPARRSPLRRPPQLPE